MLVTRAKHQSAGLSDALKLAGAEPVELPALKIIPLPVEQLQCALETPWDWIIFTSANTARLTGDQISRLSPMPKIAAIGTATADALEQAHIAVDLIPESFVAEAVLEALLAQGVAGRRILLPVAASARQVLPDGLRQAGAFVECVPVYRTCMPGEVDRALIDDIQRGGVDMLTFASPSSVRNTLHLLGGQLPPDVTIACIGPITAQELTAAGYDVDVIAADSTAAGLVNAIIEFERKRR